MRLKQRPGDFRVRELLADGYLCEQGDYRVYRVTKRKLTTPEAQRILARAAGVDPSEVEFAGLKDRQAITIQYMSVPRGRPVRVQEPELKIEPAGQAMEPISSQASHGNAFELCVRGLEPYEIRTLRRNIPVVRENGLINYFDDQRFGNITHGQGWIARDLIRGKAEKALKALLTATSPFDDDRRRAFKEGVRRNWGDWRHCRDLAGRYGEFMSVFEHLARQPNDFAGSFERVASRLKLIHLFAYQSHVWNRAVVDLVRHETKGTDTVVLDCEEGPLVSYAERVPVGLARRPSFALPGPGFEGVSPDEEEFLRDVLARERLVPDQFRIDGIGGFQLKGEPRQLIVLPRHLRVRPAEPDPANRGSQMIRVRFELPRGAYATLVVKRLFARTAGERERQDERRSAQPRTGRARRYSNPAHQGSPRRSGSYRPQRAGESGSSEGRRWSQSPGKNKRFKKPRNP